MPRFPILIALIALLCPAMSANAATFRLGGDESLNCRMTIEGEIVEGDAARFRDMLAEYVLSRLPEDPSASGSLYEFMQPARICLDSPGGSISEAIEMADTLAFGYRVREDIGPLMPEYWMASGFIWRVGTAVPAGARCESACAILFMAGGDFLDLSVSANGRDPNRVLHVEGRLGFHAPSLTVPEGNYSQETVTQAFGLAINAVQAIAQRLDRYRISQTLFQQMVSTPSDDMYYVNTVGEAASWHIGLAGGPVIDEPSEGNINWVCRNMIVHATAGPLLEDRYTQGGAPSGIRSETIPLFGMTPPVGLNDTYRWRLNTLGEITEEKLPDVVEYSNPDCEFTYDTATGQIDFFRYPASDHGLSTNNSGDLIVGLEPHGWMLFPEYVTLSELSDLARAHGDGRVPGDAVLRPVVDLMEGYCAIYDGNDRLRADAPCTAELSSFRRVDLRSHAERYVIDWPDGLTPELPTGSDLGSQRIGTWERLDFRLAGMEPNGIGGYVFQAPPVLQREVNYRGELGDCFRDTSNGETRCFVFEAFVSSNRSVFLE